MAAAAVASATIVQAFPWGCAPKNLSELLAKHGCASAKEGTVSDACRRDIAEHGYALAMAAASPEAKNAAPLLPQPKSQMRYADLDEPADGATTNPLVIQGEYAQRLIARRVSRNQDRQVWRLIDREVEMPFIVMVSKREEANYAAAAFPAVEAAHVAVPVATPAPAHEELPSSPLFDVQADDGYPPVRGRTPKNPIKIGDSRAEAQRKRHARAQRAFESAELTSGVCADDETEDPHVSQWDVTEAGEFLEPKLVAPPPFVMSSIDDQGQLVCTEEQRLVAATYMSNASSGVMQGLEPVSLRLALDFMTAWEKHTEQAVNTIKQLPWPLLTMMVEAVRNQNLALYVGDYARSAGNLRHTCVPIEHGSAMATSDVMRVCPLTNRRCASQDWCCVWTRPVSQEGVAMPDSQWTVLTVWRPLAAVLLSFERSSWIRRLCEARANRDRDLTPEERNIFLRTVVDDSVKLANLYLTRKALGSMVELFSTPPKAKPTPAVAPAAAAAKPKAAPKRSHKAHAAI